MKSMPIPQLSAFWLAPFILFFLLMQPFGLSAQDSRDIRSGVVNVKFSEAAHERIQASFIQDAVPKSGFAELDSFFDEVSVMRMVPVFRPPTRFVQRHRDAGLDRWFTIEYEAKSQPQQMASVLKTMPGVEKAEPDVRAISHALDAPAMPGNDDPVTVPFVGSGDPEFTQQWHYDNDGTSGGTPGADIDLVAGWSITAGTPDVVVQILDTGIDLDHPDLINMLWTDPETGLHGWNFVSDSDEIFDHNGHGTHVSGTIAAENANDIGVAGIAGGTGAGDGSRMMVARIFEPDPSGDGSVGAGSSGTAMAIVMGADLGAVISNNSWGYRNPGVFPEVVHEAIDYFIEFAGYDENGEVEGPVAGGVFISSAGNNNTGANYFPAAYGPVVSVAATDHNDQKSLYSNFGMSVDLSAPGGQLFSGNLIGGVFSTDLTGGAFPYSFKQGTSMASPHVAGVAALVASAHPGITNEELVSRLVNNSININSQNPNFAGLLGSGRLNTFLALAADPPPGRPALLSPEHQAEDRETDLTFEWNAAVLASTHDFELSTDSLFSSTVEEFAGISGTTVSVSGLEEATTYYWRVRGINSEGTGMWSDVFAFTTAGVVSLGEPSEVPEAITLYQNYPNPFNPDTRIRFTLTESANTELAVYTIAGRRVRVLSSGTLSAGTHDVVFDAAGLASGIYIYVLRTGNTVLQRKMMLLK